MSINKYLTFSVVVHTIPALCFYIQSLNLEDSSDSSKNVSSYEINIDDSNNGSEPIQKQNKVEVVGSQKESLKSSGFTKGNSILSDGDKLNGEVHHYVGLGLEFADETLFINSSEGRVVGFKVVDVNPLYGAFKAGIKVGDVILKVNDFSIKNKIQLSPDQMVKVLVLRNNSVLSLKVKAMMIPYS